jgi:hypothetical protein
MALLLLVVPGVVVLRDNQAARWCDEPRVRDCAGASLSTIVAAVRAAHGGHQTRLSADGRACVAAVTVAWRHSGAWLCVCVGVACVTRCAAVVVAVSTVAMLTTAASLSRRRVASVAATPQVKSPAASRPCAVVPPVTAALPSPRYDGRHRRWCVAGLERARDAHVSHSTLVSLSGLAGSLSRNLDRVSLDDKDVRRREVARRDASNGAGAGFRQDCGHRHRC